MIGTLFYRFLGFSLDINAPNQENEATLKIGQLNLQKKKEYYKFEWIKKIKILLNIKKNIIRRYLNYFTKTTKSK